jgi:hypothetical protein
MPSAGLLPVAWISMGGATDTDTSMVRLPVVEVIFILVSPVVQGVGEMP